MDTKKTLKIPVILKVVTKWIPYMTNLGIVT